MKIFALYVANVMLGVIVLFSLQWLDREFSLLRNRKRHKLIFPGLVIACAILSAVASIGLMMAM